MAERKTHFLHNPDGGSTEFAVEAFPTRVDIYDAEGDLCISVEVPREGGLDPLAQAEAAKVLPAQISYPLVTAGRDPGIDALAIMCALLEPLTPADRAGCLCWLATRFPDPAVVPVPAAAPCAR